MSLLPTVAFLFCLQCMSGAVLGQTVTPSLSDELLTLPCESINSTDVEVYQWTEIIAQSQEKNIYVVGSAGIGTYPTDPKYNNFMTNVSSYPTSVPLIIDNILPADEGRYMCTAVFAGYTQSYDVRVEALPTSVSVSCANPSPDECPEPGGVSSEFTCTCSAVGAYPGDLQFKWTSAVGDPTSTSIDSNDERSWAFDYTGIATFSPTVDENTVTCSLGGYSGSWSVPYSNYTVVPPGKCNISVSCNDEATVATLTCSCPNGVPGDPIYIYYNENGDVVTSEVPVTPGVQFTVGCRGCNGVNFGEDTFISKNHTCTVTTVTTPSISTKEDGTPTGTTGPPVGLIIGLSVGIPILIIILVLVIWFLKNRDGDSDKNKPDDDSVNDFGNKETPAVYAVPDKNKKRPPQPTAAPRTSQNVPDDQPMQEIQYADLDHGKQPPTNEIRKPQDEPTEYATVQSVIV